MDKITYDEYLKMARDPQVEDETLLEYVNIVPGEGGFDFTFVPNPDRVEISLEDLEYENAMQTGNRLSRYRRQARFRWRQSLGLDLPVVVSEGDSWFQFPLLVREIIDQLEDHYLIWSIGAAGDTASNMVLNTTGREKTEYLKELLKKKDEVRGFLFSGAGNDVIGQDPDTQQPVLFDLLNDFNGDVTDVIGHINHGLLRQKLDFLQDVYHQFIRNIRAVPEFAELPIFVHGYDYPFPYPWGTDDPRDPWHAANDEWLGKPLNNRNIVDQTLRREIIKFLIDALYQRLDWVAGNPQSTGVILIDCRGAMPNVEDWIDEIHGTSAGFQKVAARFLPVMQRIIT